MSNDTAEAPQPEEEMPSGEMTDSEPQEQEEMPQGEME